MQIAKSNLSLIFAVIMLSSAMVMLENDVNEIIASTKNKKIERLRTDSITNSTNLRDLSTLYHAVLDINGLHYSFDYSHQDYAIYYSGGDKCLQLVSNENLEITVGKYTLNPNAMILLQKKLREMDKKQDEINAKLAKTKSK